MGADDAKQAIFTQAQQDISRKLPDPGWSGRQKLALAARFLAADGHASGLAGQITLRHDTDTFWTIAFGLGFDEATAGNSIRIDSAMNVVEGDGFPNPANRFHAWIYRARPEAGAIVHTHAPWTAALSMTAEPLTISHMDTTLLYNDVAYLRDWPGVPVADEEGRIISSALGAKRAILLKHHGLLTLGKTMEEAAVLALFMERAAAMHLRARSIGPIEPIPAAHAEEAHDFLNTPMVVNATFNYFARGASARRRKRWSRKGTVVITLYGFWRSLAATRVRIALNIKGLAYNEISVDLLKGEQFAPQYQRLNPQSVVPSLDLGDGGPPLVQSLAILEYLDEVHPAPPLMPSLASSGGARARARVRALSLVHAADTHPLVVPRIRKFLEQELKHDEPTRNLWIRGWIDAGSRALETHLASGQGTGRYCQGDQVTLADVCVASHWIGAEMFGADRASFPTLARVMNECFTLDAFARAHPKRQPGAA